VPDGVTLSSHGQRQQAAQKRAQVAFPAQLLTHFDPVYPQASESNKYREGAHTNQRLRTSVAGQRVPPPWLKFGMRNNGWPDHDHVDHDHESQALLAKTYF